MPVTVSHPGVYVAEVSGGRPIAGVATSITAFIGRTRRGPLDLPVRVQSFADFARAFGGISSDSTVSYAVAQFFQNGGTDALVVRVAEGGAAATASVPSLVADRSAPAAAPAGALPLAAASIGTWGNALRARIEPVRADATYSLFNLSVRDDDAGLDEQFLNLSTDPAAERFVTPVLQRQSNLIRVDGDVPDRLQPGVVTDADNAQPPIHDPKMSQPFVGGADGSVLTDAAISDSSLQSTQRGIWALEKAKLFNLLCIPPLAADTDIGVATRDAAATYCGERRALFMVDPPIAWHNAADAIAGIGGLMTRSPSAALFFPCLRAPDPARNGQTSTFPPCGAVAGVLARTDGRGVWQAPAGLEARITGAIGPSVRLTDRDIGRLNPLAINGLRSFPNAGTVVWGARTLDGADGLVSDWKYISVRRLALFIEESVLRGTQWVAFEPIADTPAPLRASIGGFMADLFRQGAFQGATPAEAYFVRCDQTTTTPADLELGLVTIVIGFAPLKPAEFVIISVRISRAPSQA